MTHVLAEMSWPQVAEAQQHAPLAIVPVGSCEQHGMGLAVGTDAVRAWEFALRVADRLSPRAVLAPLLPIGVSEHHMGLPGTLTFDPVTFQQVVVEMVHSLHRQGWRKVFVLNGHGGNDAAVDIAVTRARREIADLSIAWSGITPLVGDLIADLDISDVYGHACEVETSQALYLAPALVHPDELAPGTTARADLGPAGELARATRGVHFRQPYDRISKTGSLGDQTKATREIGERLVETALDRLAAFLSGFIDLDNRG